MSGCPLGRKSKLVADVSLSEVLISLLLSESDILLRVLNGDWHAFLYC